MIETKEREINGHKYAVMQFPAMTGLRYAIKLVKMIGPSLAKTADGAGSLSSLMDKDLSSMSVSGAVESLTERLDDVGTAQFILDLFQSTHRDGVILNQGNFDSAFSANYGEMLKALAFVLEVNYGGFFGAIREGIGSLPVQEKVARASPAG